MKSLLLGLGVAVQAVCTPCLAQCLLDADGDGHPLFQSLNRRVDLEFIDGIKVQARPTDMAFGDLDGDGDLDGAFAMAKAGPPELEKRSYLTIALNRGDGVFDAPTPYFAGREVCAVALGDVDGDADLDVCVTNAYDGTVSVFLNNGDSTLGPEAVHPVGAMPRSLHVIDLNGDGLADIASLNVESEDVSILVALGDGAFAPETRVDVGVVTPRQDGNEHFPVPGPFMAAADLDADGDIDFGVPAKTSLLVLRNNGMGGFTLDAEPIEAGPEYTYDVVAADFNADGRMDLAAAVNEMPLPLPVGLVVTLQAEDGTFPTATEYSGDFLNVGPGMQYQHITLALGDVDSDGDVDLALGPKTQSMLGLYANKGDGTFEDAVVHLTFQGPWVVKLEDVTGDGTLDLVQLQAFGTRRPMRIHPGDADGGFIGPARSPKSGIISCFQHTAVTSVDLNLDGALDAVGGFFNSTCSDIQIGVYRNFGGGEFGVVGAMSLVPLIGGAIIVDLEVADMNGDGWPDVVAADLEQYDLEVEYPGAIWVLLNEGGLSFAAALESPLETKPFRVTLADFDGDGDVDVGAATESLHPGNGVDPEPRYVEILLNDGSGHLTHTQTILLEGDYNTDGIRGVIASGDIDGDGDVDVFATVCSNFEPSRLIRLENDGAGSFTIAADEVVGHYPSSIFLDDLDVDGDLDMALIFNKAATQALGDKIAVEPYLKIYHNDGAGNLALVQEFADSAVMPQWDLDGADFNADGFPDLAMEMMWGAVMVQLNNRDGTFAPGVAYDQLDVLGAQTVGDFTGDGLPDVLGAALIDEGVLMLLPNESCPACAADVNGDGALNILDFVAFQLLWQDQDPAADCDANAEFDVLDFVCFQQLFVAGCP